ncbi:hypothetical protein BJX66DRAFT_289295 [Aspergillus keveii]|uniref:Uncharacterized protein n=1 Tax=Aspergillus keveii TaxID=714993 RepID=A0ABR4GQ71_9EURO
MKLRAPQEKKTPYEYFMFHIWRYQLSVKKDTLPLPMAVLYTSQSSQVLNGPQRHSLEFVPLLRGRRHDARSDDIRAATLRRGNKCEIPRLCAIPRSTWADVPNNSHVCIQTAENGSDIVLLAGLRPCVRCPMFSLEEMMPVSGKTVATSASGEARTRSSVSTAGRYTSRAQSAT